MTRYIALLRGINVGGKNKISMGALKLSFERRGFSNVVTYINSGNILFDSDLDVQTAGRICGELIGADFALTIPVCIITTDELMAAVAGAPDWWDVDSDSKHNAIFIIPPMTVEEVVSEIGDYKPDYEKLDSCGDVIFWSEPTATYTRSRLTKIVQSKALYNAITIRNANTAKKLAALASEGSQHKPSD